MNPGELLSRKFTSKDTHSAAGDLLVMYAEVGGWVGVSSLDVFVWAVTWGAGREGNETG